MATEAMIDHSRALLQGKMDEAKTCVERLAAVDQPEAEYRLTVYVEVVTVQLLWLFAIYLDKPVGSQFEQMVSKILDW